MDRAESQFTADIACFLYLHARFKCLIVYRFKFVVNGKLLIPTDWPTTLTVILQPTGKGNRGNSQPGIPMLRFKTISIYFGGLSNFQNTRVELQSKKNHSEG
mgnify:CR=1 FL=1